MRALPPITRGPLLGLVAAGVVASAAIATCWPEPWDVRCAVVSDVELSWFDGQIGRMLPSRRPGFSVEGEIRDGELVGMGDIGPGPAVIAVDRASAVATVLVGRRRLACSEPIALVPLSAEVAGVVDGQATHVEGCGAGSEAAVVDPRDSSFFFYGEPGPCELRACQDDGRCGDAIELRLEHEGSVVVELPSP